MFANCQLMGTDMGFPDVCITPAAPSPIPVPYPNIAMSSDTADGSTTVTCDGNPIMLSSSNFMMSTGDEAGSIGGVKDRAGTRPS